MTTPQFVAWLDSKMVAFGNGKLVPPAAVLTTDLSDTLKHQLHRHITEQILREARIQERIATALQEIELPVPDHLHAVVDQVLAGEPAASWRAAVAQVADRLLAARGSAGASPESRP